MINRLFTPNNNYDIELNISGNDYSNYLNGVTIATSIINPYQVVILSIGINTSDIILNKLYGQESIKLTIRLLQKNGTVLEETLFDLIIVTSNFDMVNDATLSLVKETMGRLNFNIVCVTKDPFKLMTTTVNKIFKGKRIQNIIETMVTDINDIITPSIDTKEINKEIIPQIIIPPMVFHKSLKYINDFFGIYNGLFCSFCSYDNIFYMKNLTEKMKMAQTFNVYVISVTEEGDIIDKIHNEANEGKSFYSFEAINSSYNANASFAKLAPEINYIRFPLTKFYQTEQRNLENVCQNRGLIYKNKELFIEKKGIMLEKRKSYKPDFCTNFTDNFSPVVISELVKKISAFSTIGVKLKGSMRIKKLMDVGEPLMLNPMIIDYIPLSGKYIFKSSEIIFSRETSNWMANANIQMIRTNKVSS